MEIRIIKKIIAVDVEIVSHANEFVLIFGNLFEVFVSVVKLLNHLLNLVLDLLLYQLSEFVSLLLESFRK